MDEKKYVGKFQNVNVYEDSNNVYYQEDDGEDFPFPKRMVTRAKKGKELLTRKPNVPEETDVTHIVAVGDTLQIVVLWATLGQTGIRMGNFYEIEDYEERDTLYHGYHEYYGIEKNNTYEHFKKKSKILELMGKEMLVHDYEYGLYNKIIQL